MTFKIGIPAQNHDDKFGCNTNYLKFIYQFGNPIVILPERVEDFHEIYKLDALLLPGGSDVDPKRYSNRPLFDTYNPNIYLEHFDNQILPTLIGNIPVFGICRGLQTLNVHFGGTLRNLYFHPYSSYDEQESHPVWKADIDKWNKNNHEFKVNSFHHQSIGALANNFKIELVDFKDNVIEAITDEKRKIAAVQWHPERLLDNYSTNLFKSILK